MQLIITHANCPDGYASFWAARKKWPSADVVWANYGDAPPNVAGRDVYIADFSYPRGVLENMHAVARSLVVDDHHETAETELVGLDYCHFDMNHSGCVLAWSRLFPDQPVPRLLQYIEDRDLWKHTLPNSKEIYAAISSYDKSLERWDRLEERIDSDFGALVSEGAAILRYTSKLVTSVAKRAFPVEIAGRKGLGIYSTVFASEIGNELAEHADYGAIFNIQQDGKVRIELRSKQGTATHVSEIAKAMGGGGHKHAAGFVRSFVDFWWPHA